MISGQRLGTFLKEYTFFIFAIALMVSFPFSESTLSFSAGFIALQILFTGNYRSKWEVLKTDRSLWALMAIYSIYLLGCLFCKDKAVGAYELKKTIFWIILPFGVALSPKLSAKKFWVLLFLFVCFVTVASIITSIKIIYQEQLNIRDIRDASFVSHVSFSFQIILSIFILVYSFFKKPPVFNSIKPYWLIVWGLCMGIFLIMQKSLLGILSFYISAIILVIWVITQFNQIKQKNYLRGLAIVLFLLPFIYVGYIAARFYSIQDEIPKPDQKKTALGNNYSFKFDKKQLENGHYVHWYICKEELEESWTQRSQLSLSDKDAMGYRIYYTLIRYMTSKGLKKDAEGVMALTDEDVQNVINGISNHIFVDKKYSLYPRIYQTLWEINEYRNTGNPNNQSLSQRFEYMNAAIYIIKHNFWGIGTGNFKMEFANAYDEIGTKLKKEFQFHVHNQYLSYMVKFGILGLIVIISLLAYSIYYKNQFRNVLLLGLLMVLFVSNFGEAILETHVGLSFFVFFISLFIWHSPKELSNSL